MRCLLLFVALLSSLGAAPPPPFSASRPFGTLSRLAPLLAAHAAAPFPPGDAALLLARAAPAFTAARNYTAAASARLELATLAASAYMASPNASTFQALLLARVAAVEALTHAGSYDAAHRVVVLARDEVHGAAGARVVALKSASAAADGLWRAEAAVLNCAGGGERGAVEALAAWERGAPPEGWLAPIRSELHERLARDYLGLLQRAPGGGAAARRGAVEAALLARGPWRRADQLPRHFSPALRGEPWYDPAAPPWSALAPLAAALAAAAPALRAEWRALERAHAHLILPEAECIAEGAGVWRYFTVNAPWVEAVDGAGCSLHAPAACALLAAAAAAGWGGDVLRGTFSAVRGGGRLREHCGMTNAQLKLHVGLVVPRVWEEGGGGGGGGGGRPCAWLTVAGERRAWEEGAVLMFDDSFLHSVDNECPGDEERVVFQLVLPHGDARGEGAAGAWGD